MPADAIETTSDSSERPAAAISAAVSAATAAGVAPEAAEHRRAAAPRVRAASAAELNESVLVPSSSVASIQAAEAQPGTRLSGVRREGGREEEEEEEEEEAAAERSAEARARLGSSFADGEEEAAP